MTYWNHRVVKEIFEDGSEWFSVREVFYNDDGSIYAYVDCAVDVGGESIEDLREYTQWILDCLDKDVLIDGEVEFVDPDVIEAERLGFDSVEEYLESLEDLDDEDL